MKKSILIIIALVTLVALGGLSFYGARKLVRNTYSLYLQYKYPLKYSEQIKKYAEEFGLEKELVSAVVYEESRFRPESSSDKGAIGLMQLLPDTAEYIAKKIDDKEYKEENLASADINIRYGCYYLSYLHKKYSDWDKTLAAYNAGEGNVDRWITEGDYQVRFEETRNFVDRVKASKEMYKLIYFPN